MVIAVNTRLLIDDIHGGIEWFTYESMLRITCRHPEHRFLFIFDRQYDNRYIFADNITPVVLGPRAVHPLLWYYWMEYRVAPFLEKSGADLFVSPDGMIPLRTTVPCLPVIHDINFWHRRSDLPLLKSLYFRRYFPKFAGRARRIATVSLYSRQDISQTWKIEPSRIDVVYNGISDIYLVNGSSARRPVKEPYFLFVGNLSPRKNVATLVKAFNSFRDNNNMRYRLVIAGDRFFLNSSLDREIRRSPYRDDIITPGKKSPQELSELYRNAEALVFVPWFEGFGIPVAEAMACGTPVITSDTTSMPEVAGGAALLVDPADEKMIADAMRRVAEEEGLRESLVERGKKQASLFRWDNTAVALWESMMNSIKSQ